jgi:hypothetical protein
MHRAAGFLALALAFSACKSEPKDVTLGGYTFTVPSNFSAEEKQAGTVRHVSFDSFSFDGSCLVEIFPGAVEPAEWVQTLEKSFAARQVKKATFTTRFATLEGDRFTGKIPAESTLGAIAQLAGTPDFELYAARDGAQTIGLMVMLVGEPAERATARRICTGILGSMRAAHGP